MSTNLRKTLPGLLACVQLATSCFGADAPNQQDDGVGKWEHTRDVVYGYKDGLALVLDVFTPRASQNGAGVIRLMSGGMKSQPAWSHIAPNYRPEVRELLQHGYVVFAVAHGSKPRYTIDEAHQDVSRAIRFVRHHHARFGVGSKRIGLVGASSGGHLSLLAATNPPAPESDADDRVDRETSDVQAVVSYYAGTDNLNFGAECVTIADHFRSLGLSTGEFDFHDFDKQLGRFERVTDPKELKQRFRLTSPIAHVDARTPPVLILHGEDDKLVPIQQSELFVSRLQRFDVPHKLLRFPGVGHGFNNGWEKSMPGEIPAILDWFDEHLLDK